MSKVFLLIPALSLATIIVATGQSSTDFYSLPDDSALGIGSGFDPITYKRSGDCVEGATLRDEKRGGAKVYLSYVFTRNEEQVERAMGLDVRANYRSLGSSYTGSFALSEELRSASKTLSLTIIATADYASERHTGFTLRKEFAKLPPTEFRQRCGTHFIDAERRGTRVAVTLTASNLDDDFFQKVNAQLGYRSEGLVASGGLDVLFSQRYASARKGTSAGVEIKVVGSPDLDKLLKPMLQKQFDEPDPVQAIGAGLNGMSELLTKENARVVGFNVLSYDFLRKDLGAPLPLDDLADERLRHIAIRYGEAFYFRTVISDIQNGVDPLAAEWAGDDRQNSLISILKELDSYLDSVKAAHEQCLQARKCAAPANLPKSVGHIKPYRYPTVTTVFFADGQELQEDENQRLRVGWPDLLASVKGLRPNATSAAVAIKVGTLDPRVSIKTVSLAVGPTLLAGAPLCRTDASGVSNVLMFVRGAQGAIPSQVAGKDSLSCGVPGFDPYPGAARLYDPKQHTGDGVHAIYALITDNRGRTFRAHLANSYWKAKQPPPTSYEHFHYPQIVWCKDKSVNCSTAVAEWDSYRTK